MEFLLFFFCFIGFLFRGGGTGGRFVGEVSVPGVKAGRVGVFGVFPEGLAAGEIHVELMVRVTFGAEDGPG